MKYYKEYILTSNQHVIKNNCLRYSFQKPIRFQNQYVSLTSMIFYNYFEDKSDKFKLAIRNKHNHILLILQMDLIMLVIFQKL